MQRQLDKHKVVGHSTGKILTKFWRVMGAAAMIMMGSLYMVIDEVDEDEGRLLLRYVLEYLEFKARRSLST